jgi:hypothetical protein
MVSPRFAFRLMLAGCLVGCVALSACNKSDNGSEASQSGFRLSLSKREVPVPDKVVR